MRRLPAPPPEPETLPSTPIHRVVAEWPETLAVLRDAGVETGPTGGAPLSRRRDAGELAERILRATAWRPTATTGSTTGGEHSS